MSLCHPVTGKVGAVMTGYDCVQGINFVDALAHGDLVTKAVVLAGFVGLVFGLGKALVVVVESFEHVRRVPELEREIRELRGENPE